MNNLTVETLQKKYFLQQVTAAISIADILWDLNLNFEPHYFKYISNDKNFKLVEWFWFKTSKTFTISERNHRALNPKQISYEPNKFFMIIFMLFFHHLLEWHCFLSFFMLNVDFLFIILVTIIHFMVRNFICVFFCVSSNKSPILLFLSHVWKIYVLSLFVCLTSNENDRWRCFFIVFTWRIVCGFILFVWIRMDMCLLILLHCKLSCVPLNKFLTLIDFRDVIVGVEIVRAGFCLLSTHLFDLENELNKSENGWMGKIIELNKKKLILRGRNCCSIIKECFNILKDYTNWLEKKNFCKFDVQLTLFEFLVISYRIILKATFGAIKEN